MWPHTPLLGFEPEGLRSAADAATLERLARTTDPVEVCGLFVDHVGGAPATEVEQAVLREAVEWAQHRTDADADVA